MLRKNSLLFFLFSMLFLNTLQSADIAVVTMAIGEGYQKMVAPSIENKRLYCQKHGYDFINLTENLDSSRPIAWNKILILQEVLKNKEYKWVFWTDADAIFMNFGISLEELIDENYNFLVGSDLVGCNTGNFLLKNNSWSEDFLKLVYSHEECIYNRYWEQAAVMVELKQNENIRQYTQVLAPRIINSYPQPLHGLAEVYQPGDFILHFATLNGPILIELMNRYAASVIDDPDALNLDTFLDIHGLQMAPHANPSVNEGCVTESQKEQYIAALKEYESIKKIAVIGFNAGHSTQIFFQGCKGVRLIACDLNLNSFTQLGVNFMHRKYPQQFSFFEGDAAEAFNPYLLNHSEDKCDLIYINGDKAFESRLNDIMASKQLAKKGTILWVNDYAGEIARAVDQAVAQGVIVVDQKHEDPNPKGGRSWIVAHYVFP